SAHGPPVERLGRRLDRAGLPHVRRGPRGDATLASHAVRPEPDPGLDVLGMGIVTIDDLLYVESYPPPAAKVPVLRRDRQCGGLTGPALVAAARLGARCAFAGVLGRDADSDFVADALGRAGIDTTLAKRVEGASPITSTIIIGDGGHTR